MEDPIYRYFHDQNVPEGESAWQFVDRAYLRCFQVENPTENVLRGPYGMDLVISFLKELAQHRSMDSDGLQMLALKIQQLVELVHKT